MLPPKMKLSAILFFLFALSGAAALIRTEEDTRSPEESLVAPASAQQIIQSQEAEEPEYTPQEVQKFLHTYASAKYRGRISDALLDADTNGDGSLDEEEANVLLSKAVAFATGQEEFGDGVGGRVDVIIIIFIRGLKKIVITIIIIVGEVTRDPHVMTWGNKHLGFSGVCDLLLMKNPTFAKGTGMEIQGRTSGTVRPDGAQGSVLTSASVRIGANTLEIHSDGTHFVNGVENAPIVNAFASSQFIVFKEEGDFCFGPGLHERCAPSVNFDITTRVVEYTDVLISQHIYITAHRGYLDLTVAFSDETLTGTSGLMGTYPWDGPNDKIARDGMTVMTDPTAFGLEWQVDLGAGDGAKMFMETRAPQLPDAQCILPSVASAGRRNLRQVLSA